MEYGYKKQIASMTCWYSMVHTTIKTSVNDSLAAFLIIAAQSSCFNYLRAIHYALDWHFKSLNLVIVMVSVCVRSDNARGSARALLRIHMQLSCHICMLQKFLNLRVSSPVFLVARLLCEKYCSLYSFKNLQKFIVSIQKFADI